MFLLCFEDSLSAYSNPKKNTLYATINRKSNFISEYQWKCKIVPWKVGYFSKIEEILPYCPECPKGPKMEIHVGNLAVELDNLPWGKLSIWKWSERSSTEPIKMSLGERKVGIGTNSNPLGISSCRINQTFFGNCVLNYRIPWFKKKML